MLLLKLYTAVMWVNTSIYKHRFIDRSVFIQLRHDSKITLRIPEGYNIPPLKTKSLFNIILKFVPLYSLQSNLMSLYIFNTLTQIL